MMDCLRHAGLIFVLITVSKASSVVYIDMCRNQTIEVVDGQHGYLRYNRSIIDSGSPNGACRCWITKGGNGYYDPYVDIWRTKDSSICGTTCCTEQLYIYGPDEGTYGSCTDDEPSLHGCLFSRERSLLNAGKIDGKNSVNIVFYYSEVMPITDSFTFELKVSDYCPGCTPEIQITCTEPEFGPPLASTCSTTHKSTTATPVTGQQGENTLPQTSIPHTEAPNTDSTSSLTYLTTDTASETASPQSDKPNVGLIAGVSISCLCVIAGIIAVAVFITRRNKKASEKKMPKRDTLPKIHKEYDQFSTELVDNTMYSSTTSPDMPSGNMYIMDNLQYMSTSASGMPSPDMYIVDNPQYSCRQTPDNQLSADTYVMDNPQYGSMPTHPGPGTELIEDTVYMEADIGNDDTTYMEADMDCIDHHMNNSQQQDSVYVGGTQLFENAIYDNQPFDARMSDGQGDNTLNICTNGTIDITDGTNGYIEYNRTTSTQGGICACDMTALEGNPYVKIFTEKYNRICGRTNCTEQLVIQAEVLIYDSCNNDTGTPSGDCLILENTHLADNSINNKSIRMQFKFSEKSSQAQTTHKFKLRIKVVGARNRNDIIEIQCGEQRVGTASPTPDSPPRTTESSSGDTGLLTHDEMESPSAVKTPSSDVGGSIGLFLGGVVIGVVITVTAIFVRKKLQSRERSLSTKPTSDIHDAMAPTDAICTELVDNNMYSSVEASGMNTYDPPYRPSPLPESDQYAGTVLIENATYGECDVNPVGHHRKTAPDEAVYSMVTDANMDSGGSEGPSSDSADYFSGTQLVENNLYSQ